MKRICFISTHLGSNSSILTDLLQKNSQIDMFRLPVGKQIFNPLDLLGLTQPKHKTNHKTSIYLYETLYNYEISYTNIFDVCKFIYLVRRPEKTIPWLLNVKDMAVESAVSYYMFRLRRICEMCKKNPQAVFLTEDNLLEGKGLETIAKYLGLKESLSIKDMSWPTEKLNFKKIDYKMIQNLEARYEKYLFWVKKSTLVHTEN